MTMSKHVRCKLFNDECRVWNMDITGVTCHSYMMSYMEQELHILNVLNICRASRNLSAMSSTEKNVYLRNYSQYVHRSTDELDVFYSRFNKTDVVLFYALESMLVYFNRKIK